jgi:hypothetical protein
MPSGRQPGAAATADLGGHGLDREAAVTPPLRTGCDVETPEPGTDVRARSVAQPVDAQESHEEADRSAVVKDETGPGCSGMDIGLGQRLHDRRDQVFLLRTDPHADGGVHGVRSDLFQTECARHGEILRRLIG